MALLTVVVGNQGYSSSLPVPSTSLRSSAISVRIGQCARVRQLLGGAVFIRAAERLQRGPAVLQVDQPQPDVDQDREELTSHSYMPPTALS